MENIGNMNHLSIIKHPGKLRFYPKYLIYFFNNNRRLHVMHNCLYDTEETVYTSSSKRQLSLSGWIMVKKTKQNFNSIHFNHSFFISSKVYGEHFKEQHFQTLEKKNLQSVHSLNYKQSRHDMKEYWVQEALKSWWKAVAWPSGSWGVEVLISRGPLHSSRFLSN